MWFGVYKPGGGENFCGIRRSLVIGHTKAIAECYDERMMPNAGKTQATRAGSDKDKEHDDEDDAATKTTTKATNTMTITTTTTKAMMRESNSS